MRLKKLPDPLTVCKLASAKLMDPEDDFCFIGRTDEEISLVCRTANVPAQTLAREDGWRAFRVEGVLDFALTGILASLASVLAEKGIAIFAVSTFNTDYILVKEADAAPAAAALEAAGHEITG